VLRSGASPARTGHSPSLLQRSASARNSGGGSIVETNRRPGAFSATWHASSVRGGATFSPVPSHFVVLAIATLLRLATDG